MNIHAGELANLILKKSLQECSTEELQQLVQQYPYFGPAHFLLTKKLQEDNSSLYEEQVQNTALYFHNRVWLHHLLNDDGNTNKTFEKHLPAEENQFSGSVITENKEEELISQPDHEEIVDQVETPVEILAMTTESFVPSFTNENIDAPPAIGPQKEETMETALPVEAPSLKIEPFPADAGLIFEPYHTVDYFASQGIKFKEDERPKDRFSAQLKSFTEWLKTMKRVPVSEIIATTDAGTEKKVEQMAEYSLAERHVITEAMAEVWKKQGNKARAEDIYNKLSLLDPSKSSYFAAKIEDLKKTS